MVFGWIVFAHGVARCHKFSDGFLVRGPVRCVPVMRLVRRCKFGLLLEQFGKHISISSTIN